MTINFQDDVTPLDAAHMNQLEQKVSKAQPNGYPSLDGTGKVPAAQLPPPFTLPARLIDQTGNAPITDANTALTSGWYGLNTGATNLPGGYTLGYLEVYSWSVPGNVVVQFFHPFNVNETWRRYLYGGWSGWVKTFPIDDANLPARLTSQGQFNQTSDLNTVSVQGFYYWTPSAVNAPPGGGDGNLIMVGHSAGYQTQHAVPLHRDEVWVRRCDGGTWAGWIQVYPVSEAGLPDRLKATIPAASTDCNSPVSGWSFFTPTTTGGPGAAGYYGWILSMLFADQGATQIATASSGGVMWFRFRPGGPGAWSGWIQVAPINNTNLPSRIWSYGADAGTDANTLTDSGWYHLYPPATNGPWNTDWHLFVIRHNDPAYCKQTAFSYYSDEMWTRVKGGPGVPFSAWRRVYPIDDNGVPARIAPSALSVSDWNVANQNGYYYSNGSAANAPIQGYWLLGQVVNGSSGLTQKVWTRDFPNEWIRQFNASSWSPWIAMHECNAAGTVRKTIGGYVTGTLDGNGQAVISFGRSVGNVASIVVTNGHTGQLNVMYTATSYTASGFTLVGWVQPTNAPAANQPYAMAWQALVDAV